MTPPASVRIGEEEVHEDRFSRFRLIPWWDQKKLQAARVLVIGAGALGNEILKNLALLGFERIVVVDVDRIEESNLSRAILFSSEDVGSFKAEAAARSLQKIAPQARVRSLVANVVQNCGLGLFAWSDVIIAGLDNREARLWINRCAWKMNRPWIDGAIEGINGVARVFAAGTAPCYECTLGETDWKLLEQRMSCNLLLREANTEGKVATTPTISSVIAGIEVQEAVKLVFDRADNFVAAMAHVEAADTPRKVEIAVAVDIFEPGIFGLGDINRRAVRKPARHRFRAALRQSLRFRSRNCSAKLNSGHSINSKWVVDSG